MVFLVWEMIIYAGEMMFYRIYGITIPENTKLKSEQIILFSRENGNLGRENCISGLENAHLDGRNGVLWYLWDNHTSKILS